MCPVDVCTAWRWPCRSAAKGRCGRSWWWATGEESTWWAMNKLPSSARDWRLSRPKTWWGWLVSTRWSPGQRLHMWAERPKRLNLAQKTFTVVLTLFPLELFSPPPTLLTLSVPPSYVASQLCHFPLQLLCVCSLFPTSCAHRRKRLQSGSRLHIQLYF